jgi:hypothetical protein
LSPKKGDYQMCSREELFLAAVPAEYREWAADYLAQVGLPETLREFLEDLADEAYDEIDWDTDALYRYQRLDAELRKWQESGEIPRQE